VKDRDPSLYLTHVLESIDLARSYVEGVDFQRFSESQQLRDAVIRRIAGMRDKVVHDYMGVDIEMVWTVVHRDLPELALEVRRLLEQQRGEEGPA